MKGEREYIAERLRRVTAVVVLVFLFVGAFWHTSSLVEAAGTLTITSYTKATGSISVVGNVSKGGGSFLIDDPIDPVNKLLYHSFVESPDVKNMYDGLVVLDNNGSATVSLPSYFMALNQDFRYLVTPIGEPMPGLYISGEVHKYLFGLLGTPVFSISGGKAGGKVSWQVTGIRHDAYIKDNPIVPEVEKGPGTLVKKGELLFPGLYDKDGNPTIK